VEAKSPAQWASYWKNEFKSAREPDSKTNWRGVDSWKSAAESVDKVYTLSRGLEDAETQLNLFASGVQLQHAILFSSAPSCEVKRQFDDPDDDDARLASLIAKRLLNRGLEDERGAFNSALNQLTLDRLVAGFGLARAVYEADYNTVPAVEAITAQEPCTCDSLSQQYTPVPESEASPVPCALCGGTGAVAREVAPPVPETEVATNERIEVVYSHWRDQLWSPSKTWGEVRWFAFKTCMSSKQIVEAFGDNTLGVLGLDPESNKRTEVWEIWDKEHRMVHWYVDSATATLSHLDNPTGEDPLGLSGFFPFPAPLMANAPTVSLTPIPDYQYAKDQYRQIDALTSRITAIVASIRVTGTYDRSQGKLEDLLSEVNENRLIPVDNWASFMERGGLKGSVDLLPIEPQVQALVVLVQQRNDLINSVYQITGLSDILRGQQVLAETATTTAIKAEFASVRLRCIQLEIARFIADLQQIRLEMIAKNFSVDSMLSQSNILLTQECQTPEGYQRAVRAVELLKSGQLSMRVLVRPEQLSTQSLAWLKAQRIEVLTGIGSYFSSMMPLLSLASQQGPAALSSALRFVLDAAKWYVAALPAATEIEGAFDTFTQQVERLASAPPIAQAPTPDAKAVEQAAKTRSDIAVTAAETQGRLAEIAAETQKEVVTRATDAKYDALSRRDEQAVKSITRGLPPIVVAPT